MTSLKSELGGIIGGIGDIRFQGEGEYSKGIAFTPLAISIKVTPWLKKTLALVDQRSSPYGSSVGGDMELEHDDGLRRLVVEALGDKEHKELFSEYVALKSESTTLSELRNMMLGINIRHSRGSFTVSLDEGKSSGDVWYIPLDAGDRSAITVSEFSYMEVSVLGMQLHLSNGWELSDYSSLVNHDRNTWALRCMQFQANSTLKFYVVVRFNWAELHEDEIREILTGFSSKMMAALELGGNMVANEDTFPSSFKANVVGICWDLPLAEHRLKMAGLWNED